MITIDQQVEKDKVYCYMKLTFAVQQRLFQYQ